MTDPRTAIVEAAATLIGTYGKGSPEVFAIWRDVLPATWTDAQVRQYTATKEWCGGSALHAIRLAGFAPDVHWIDGIGFIGAAHLRRLTAGETPLPGDIAVKEKPFAHHMIVEFYHSANEWGDLAGNTPFYQRHAHASSVGIDFYSVASLLPLPEAGFSRDSPFAVPGVQDLPGAGKA